VDSFVAVSCATSPFQLWFARKPTVLTPGVFATSVTEEAATASKSAVAVMKQWPSALQESRFEYRDRAR